MNERFDLAAYLRRIGYDGPVSVSSSTLREVHRLHVQTMPFENLNPLLRWDIPLDVVSLQQKMVQGRRGGYCFEQNLLLKHALEAIGFTVTGLAARVLSNRAPDSMPPRTHMLLLVETQDGPWLADAGFGGMTLAEPVKLEVDVIQPTSHERRRLRVAPPPTDASGAASPHNAAHAGGPMGSGGATGSDGATSTAEAAGTDGATASDGATGSDGAASTDGAAGTNGATASDGAASTDGAAGTDEAAHSDRAKGCGEAANLDAPASFPTEFLMEAGIRDEWRALYRFNLEPQTIADYEMANFYVANRPGSHFRSGLTAARPTTEGRYGLRNNELAIHDLEGNTERRTLTSAAELRDALTDLFLIDVPKDPKLNDVLARLAAGETIDEAP